LDCGRAHRLPSAALRVGARFAAVAGCAGPEATGPHMPRAYPIVIRTGTGNAVIQPRRAACEIKAESL